MNFKIRKKLRLGFSYVLNESDTDSIDETIDGISIPSVSENTLVIITFTYLFI